jgi:SAM-dependent methyltransferase
MVEAQEKIMTSEIKSVSDIKEIENNLETFKHYAHLPASDKIESHYDGLQDYDYLMDKIGYNDYEYAREILLKLAVPKTANIIDFGCGTGKLAKCIAKEGYTTMDGMDGSTVQLDKARAENPPLYGDLKKIFVGSDDFPKEWIDKYDCAITVGCLFQSHFPKAVFELMRSSVKKGSFIMFSMRDFYWDDANEMQYKVEMDKLVAEKKVELVTRLKFTKYEGMTEDKGFGVFVEQPCSVWAFKTL